MKYILTLATLVFAPSCFGQVPDYVPTDGLVAWWDMNGNGEDSGPFQINPVTSYYMSGSDRFGNPNGSFNSADNRFIDYGVHPEIQNESFSFAAWIRPITLGGHRTIMGYHADGAGGATLGLYESGIKFHTNHWINEGLVSGGSLVVETWFHVVGTYSQGFLTLYINGTIDSQLEGVDSPNSNSENFEVGRWTGSETQHFNGYIDDVGLWNRSLNEDEVLALYLAEALVGCVDSSACNFNPAANASDGSCEYGCLNCGSGTVWDESVQLCVIANPSDTDFDGCVGMTDLLNLLSVFGTCNEVPWSCEDLLEYQGYNYQTVQIGDQCWFAENLRSENYLNGDAILSGLSGDEWSTVNVGAVSTFGEGESNCYNYSPNGDACNETWALSEYGRLYNWHATVDDRGLCPTDWHVSSDSDWLLLMEFLGGSFDAEMAMKTTTGWSNSGDGSNTSGFSGLPGGQRSNNLGNFNLSGTHGYWWSSSAEGMDAVGYYLSNLNEGLIRFAEDPRYGSSVRCIRDLE